MQQQTPLTLQSQSFAAKKEKKQEWSILSLQFNVFEGQPR